MTQPASRETFAPTPIKRKHKKRAGNVSVCSRCENEPPLPNQRYGRACHAAAQREYWARLKEQERKMREILKIVQGAKVT